jgi:two-component system response regulator PilR (NtrC family)
VSDARGLFAAADGGTLFLDEITEIPASLQVKLLRAIQERSIRRVGDTRDVRVDVRLIAASNRDLAAAVAEGALREDLFYRLNVIPIHLPPLRDRRDDIPLLVNHFLQKLARETGKDVRGISPQALAVLERSRWPGNVRELENAIERAVVLGTAPVIDVDALPAELLRPAAAPDVTLEIPPEGLDLEATLESIEQRLLHAALERSGGVQTRAAELLRMSFRQFRYKLQKRGADDGPRAR